MLLLVLVLVPLATLVHRGDTGRWEFQRSAMAGPDEFSYLLMADHFLHGGGLSLQAELGRDTFYPPGFPLLLAGWGRLVGLTAFTAHAFNALLLCADVAVAYYVVSRILALLCGAAGEGVGAGGHRRFFVPAEPRAWLAVVIAGVFATNWHVLECSLLIMSEPSFMLATFGWLAVGLRWPRWPERLGPAAAMAALAVAAWSIRGAGIVCVAATVLYPVLTLAGDVVRHRRAGVPTPALGRRVAAVALILLMAGAYQAAITALAPEKSVTAGEESANSYPRQLLFGLTNGNRLKLSVMRDYPALALNLGKFVLSHLDDYAASFVPWPRENPDLHFRNGLGKIFGLFGLLGWLWWVGAGRALVPGGGTQAEPSRRAQLFLHVFVALYMGLYLIWPFNFARFWSPLLPVMLAFGADGLLRFLTPPSRRGRFAAAAALLALLATLGAVEDWAQLGNYGRRLNYVSDALAGGVQAVRQRSPDPVRTIVAVKQDNDALFAVAWNFRQRVPGGAGGEDGRRYRVRVARAHVAEKGGAPETDAEMLWRAVEEMRAGDGIRLYFFSYWAGPDAAALLSELRAAHPAEMAGVRIRRVYQKEIIVSVWELSRATEE
jgi:hypothetical protein